MIKVEVDLGVNQPSKIKEIESIQDEAPISLNILSDFSNREYYEICRKKNIKHLSVSFLSKSKNEMKYESEEVSNQNFLDFISLPTIQSLKLYLSTDMGQSDQSKLKETLQKLKILEKFILLNRGKSLKSQFLPNWKNLKEIELTNIIITNEFNTSLSNTKLENIKFSFCDIDEDFEFNLNLSCLKHINCLMKKRFNVQGLYKSLQGNKQSISMEFEFDDLKKELNDKNSLYLFKILRDFQIEKFTLKNIKVDFLLLKELDGKFNIKEFNVYDCQGDYSKLIDNIQNLQSFKLIDYINNDLSNLFHSLSKQDLKYLQLNNNSNFKKFEEVIENCRNLSKIIITNKKVFKSDEPFLKSFKKSNIRDLDYYAFDLPPILFENLEILKLNDLNVSLEIFTQFFESLNEHKKLKSLSLYPSLDLTHDYFKVIKKYFFINVTLKEFSILITSDIYGKIDYNVMTIIEGLYTNNSLNILSILGYPYEVNLNELFLYNYSLTELGMYIPKYIQTFLLRNQNCQNIINRKYSQDLYDIKFGFY